MLNQLKRSVVLMFALPVAAFAAPVTIVTHTAGTVDVNPDVLRGLGATTDLGTYFDKLPYTLTLTSTSDWTQPLPAKGELVSFGGANTIDLQVGDFTFHSEAHSNYYRANDSGTEERPHYAEFYYQNVGIITSEHGFFEDTEFTNRFDLPVGALSGGALSPLHVSGAKTDGVSYGGLDLTYSSPYWDGGSHMVSMYGTIDSYSIDVTGDAGAGPVTSPVPEPAAFGMLAAGLATLGLRRRFGRKAA